MGQDYVLLMFLSRLFVDHSLAGLGGEPCTNPKTWKKAPDGL